MDRESRIRLLDADPDLGRFLTAEERGEASALTVPVDELPPGPVDVAALMRRHSAFGAFVLEGMLTCHLRVGEQPGMRILGPGDLISMASAPLSMLVEDAGCAAVTPTRVAVLGRDLLVGAHRWPRLAAGLYARTTEQIERIAVQLAICQLPRVEDRLLALLWLLAESWGRVTASGTSLPLALTHETLGALVGARRPTVTLALGDLAERGAVLRQGKSWLLLEQPPRPSRQFGDLHQPSLLTTDRGAWGTREPAAAHDASAEIRATVERLREQYSASRSLVSDGLERVRDARVRSEELRRSIRDRRALRPPPAPSSG